MNLHINHNRVMRWATGIVCVLLAAHLVARYFQLYTNYDHVMGFVPLFDLDLENNVPTVVTSMYMLVSAALLMVIGLNSRQQNQPFVIHWLVLAAIFVFLAFDESTSLHERLIQPIRTHLNTGGAFYFAWVLPYGLAVLIFASFYLPFVLRLPPVVRGRMIAAGIVYVAGALGGDMIGGVYRERLGSEITLATSVIVTCEELLEFGGLLLLLSALLKYLADHVQQLQLEFVESAD